jgi:hypothetical protein
MPEGQTKSRRGRNRPDLGGLGGRRGVETENLLVGFHHSNFVAGDDLDILGVVLEKMHLAL